MSAEDATKLNDVVEDNSACASSSRPKRIVKKKEKVVKMDKGGRRRWTEEEKERLLKALQEFGPQDCRKIAQYVGTRNAFEVRFAIRYWKNQGLKVNLMNITNSKKKHMDLWRQQFMEGRPNISQQNVKILNMVELWIDMLKRQLEKKGTDGLYGLASIMKIIAQFEALPSVEEADGIDFRELYLWLAEMINGQPMRTLSGPTTHFLSESMKQLAIYGTDNLQKQKAAIERVISKSWVPVNVKSYSRKPVRKNTELEDSVERALKMPGLNPLGLDLELVKTEKLLK